MFQALIDVLCFLKTYFHLLGIKYKYFFFLNCEKYAFFFKVHPNEGIFCHNCRIAFLANVMCGLKWKVNLKIYKNLLHFLINVHKK